MKNTVFPHKFWRPFLDCMPQLFFRPQYVWFPVHLKGHLIPLCYETLVVNWQNWLLTLFHQSRSVLSPNPISRGCIIIFQFPPQMNKNNITFYASAFRRRRHYVFGLSVRPSGCPSVKSLKYPLLTCTWVRWSTRPTVTVLRHVRPSVCPSVRRGFRAFAGERMEGMAWNFTCWCILTIFRTD